MSSPDTSPRPEPLQVGDLVLDRYRVTERLEEGGTSVVYRGEDERLSRPVCIKVFQSLVGKEWTHQTTYEHFVQEAFALSRLSHPNTLRIYDFAHLKNPDDSDGPPFQVSEFMNGGTLSSLVRSEGTLSFAVTKSIVDAICGALDEAHEHEIVHRDIKPKNILFGTSGQTRTAKLCDFGIAKLLTEQGLTHQAGDTRIVSGRRLLMFSGLWASPEQLTAASVDPTADIYSFSLVTLLMLTGKCPFSSLNPREAFAERSRADELIDRISSDLPEAVVAVIKGACSLDRKMRPQSAGQFAELLGNAFALAESASHLAAAPRQDTEPPLHLTPVPDIAPEPERDTVTQRRPPLAAPNIPPTRLSATAAPHQVGSRSVSFVAMSSDGIAEVTASQGRVRMRVSMVPSSGGYTLHVRSLSCFVRKQGGRVSSAVQLTEATTLEFVASSQELVGTASVTFGQPAAGHQIFALGDYSVALGTEECATAIAFDFGPNTETVFAYMPGTNMPSAGSPQSQPSGAP